MDPQSEALRFRLRMTRGQSVEDDKRCVIPAQAGIQTGLDPQSSWGRHRATKLRMTACEIAIGDGSIGMTKRRDCRVARLMPCSSQRRQSFRHCETSFVRHCEPAGEAIPPPVSLRDIFRPSLRASRRSNPSPRVFASQQAKQSLPPCLCEPAGEAISPFRHSMT